MFPLDQRIRELDGDTFHRLCFQILHERHPDGDVRTVDGCSGDLGLDVFQGSLSGNLTIWQCKAFSKGIGNSQKQQIRESLRTALKNFKPREWVLCVSVDLDAKTHRWFQRLQKSYSDKTSIGLFDASRIVNELIHRSGIREAFFPGAVIDVIELKRAITRSGEKTLAELEAINESNLDDYIARLEADDARFNYEVVFRREPTISPQALPQLGIVMSFTSGNRTINAYARDLEALRKDPPQLTMNFVGTGVDKISEYLRTGKSQEFRGSEFHSVRSTWPLMSRTFLPSGNQLLKIAPGITLTNKRIRSKAIFASKTSSVEYGFLEFAPVRGGTDEGELALVNKNLPFGLSIVLELKGKSAHINFTEQFTGHDVREIRKFFDALRVLRDGGELTIFDLEREVALFSLIDPELPTIPQEEQFSAFVRDVAEIADYFNLRLELPTAITEEDLNSTRFLMAIIKRQPIELDNIRFGVLKSLENSVNVADQLKYPTSFRAQHQNFSPAPQIFGKPIMTGLCAMTVPVSRIDDLDRTIERFNDAEIGDTVDITIFPEAPVLFELLSPDIP